MTYSALLASLLASATAATPVSAASLQALSPTRCAGLKTLVIDAGRIGLPTHGARVTDANVRPANGQVAAYCQVDGEIAPVDPQAPPIRFEVALPLTWNGKMIGIGGGGFNGSVPAIATTFNTGSATPPLTRGYATFGDDSGHKENPAAPGDFMMNEESLRNYMGDSIKKTHDTAVAVVQAAYGRAPTRAYFVGGSTGGREALWAAGRWPDDWDAVMSFYPARGITALLGTLRMDQAFAAQGAFVPPDKRALLLAAANESCDGLDGVKDGLISNRKACEAHFVPARARYRGKPLRCPDGADVGADCLSDTQLNALAIMQESVRFDFPLAGSNMFPGYPAYTSDLGIHSQTPMDLAVLIYGLGAFPPAFPARPGMSGHFVYDNDFLRFRL